MSSTPGPELPWFTTDRPRRPTRIATRWRCRKSSGRRRRVRTVGRAVARVHPTVPAVSGPVRLPLAALTGTNQPAAPGHRARRPRITVGRDRVAGAAGRRGLHRDRLPRLAQRARARLKARRQPVLRPHWPERIPEGEPAAVLLMQSHGGHRREQPAEIAAPTFAHGVPAPGPDIEQPDEPFALALLIGWMKLALADEHQAALLAPPLIDVIGRVPKPRTPRDLSTPGRSSRASPTSVLAVADEARPAPATRSCSTNRTKPASNSTRSGRTPTSSTWTSATNTHRRRERAASRTRASRPRPPVRDGRPRRPASSSCAMWLSSTFGSHTVATPNGARTRPQQSLWAPR